MKVISEKSDNFFDVQSLLYDKPASLRMQQRTSGATIPTTTTKRHTVQNMAGMAAVYQPFYGQPFTIGRPNHQKLKHGFAI